MLDLSAIDRADSGQATYQEARPKGLHPALKWGPLAANLADAITTVYAMRSNPDAQEANPLFREIADDPVKLAAVKSIIGLITGLGADKLHKDGHETLAKILSGVSIGLPAAAAVSNARHIR